MMTVVDSLTSIALGTALFLLGRWGTRNASACVPRALPAQEGLKRERILMRGAVTCYCLAAVFIVVGILRLVV